MFDLIFNKDDTFFFKKNLRHLGEHHKKLTPKSDLQFIHKESGNSMTIAKYQSAKPLPHWRQSTTVTCDMKLFQWSASKVHGQWL